MTLIFVWSNGVIPTFYTRGEKGMGLIRRIAFDNNNVDVIFLASIFEYVLLPMIHLGLRFRFSKTNVFEKGVRDTTVFKTFTHLFLQVRLHLEQVGLQGHPSL
jgi:hypothetical protein